MSEPRNLLQEISKRPSNDVCADCQINKSEWAMIDYGIFVCNECYNYHKIISEKEIRAKSLNDETWDSLEVSMMEQNSNSKANEYYEYSLPKQYHRPNPQDSSEMKQFINDKYSLRWAKTEKREKELKATEELKKAFEECDQKLLHKLIEITFVIMIILKILHLDNVVKIFSIFLIILIDIPISGHVYEEIGILLIIQILCGMISFGFKKSFLLVLSVKLIRVGSFYIDENGLFHFFIGWMLIFLGFGLENMMISFIAFIAIPLLLFTPNNLFKTDQNKNPTNDIPK